jgi:flagellar motor component MotA
MRIIKNSVQPMEDSNEYNGILFIVGAVAGFIHIMQGPMMDLPYGVALAKAACTAFICGMCGIAGKYAFNYLKKYAFHHVKKAVNRLFIKKNKLS